MKTQIIHSYADECETIYKGAKSFDETVKIVGDALTRGDWFEGVPCAVLFENRLYIRRGSVNRSHYYGVMIDGKTFCLVSVEELTD